MCSVFSRQFDKRVTIWLDAPTACSTLRKWAAEENGALSPTREQECATNLRKAAVLLQDIHMLEEGKFAISVTGQHTTAYGSSQHQRRLLGFPFMPSASHFYTKLENASQGTMLLAHLRFALARCGWQSKDTDSWHGLLTTMLHKPRHSKFRRKLLPVTAKTVQVMQKFMAARKKKCRTYLDTVAE